MVFITTLLTHSNHDLRAINRATPGGQRLIYASSCELQVQEL